MLVIGNGESRYGIDISQYEGIKIGCNAIHRDYHVDHLICVDRRMVIDAIKSGANKKSIIYTRQDWVDGFKEHERIRTVPNLPYEGKDRWDEPFQWGSGPYALLLAAKLAKDIKMIGFDLHSKNAFVNNIYKGTEGYDPSHKNAVDPRYWVHQIGMVFNLFPSRKFTIHQPKDWKLPSSWFYPNVSVDTFNRI